MQGDTKKGLSYPKTDFVNDVRLMDSLFEDFHRDSEDGLLRKCGVVEEFTNLLEQNFKNSDGQPKYDQKLLKRFALCRTLFRMRAIARKMASDRDTLRAERKKLEFTYSSNKYVL